MSGPFIQEVRCLSPGTLRTAWSKTKAIGLDAGCHRRVSDRPTLASHLGTGVESEGSRDENPVVIPDENPSGELAGRPKVDRAGIGDG